MALRTGLVIILIAISSLGITVGVAAGEQGIALRVGILGIYDNFNPFIAEGGASLAVIDKVYEPLVRSEPGGGVRPGLASFERYGNSWVFRIREGAVWHDGRPVTAMDVEFTLDTILDPLNSERLDRAGLAGIIEGIEVIDERTIRITVKDSTTRLLRALTGIYIVPSHIFSAFDPLEYANPNPIGSGPFIYAARYGAREVELLPFKGYREEVAEISRLSIISYSSLEELVDDLLLGEIDVMGGFEAGPRELSRLLRPGISVIPRSRDLLLAIFLNTRSRPTDDVYFRRALLAALDIGELVRGRGPGVEAVGFNLLSSKHGYPPGMALDKLSPPNSTLAIELLERAGLQIGPEGWRTYLNGGEVVVRIAAPARGYPAEVARRVAGTLESLGIKSILRLLDEEGLSRTVSERSYEVIVLELPYPEDVATLFREYVTSGGSLNVAGYVDELVDRYYSYMLNATSSADLQLLAELVSRRLSERVPLIPIYAEQGYAAYRSDRILLVEVADPSSIDSLVRLRHVIRFETVTVTETVTTTFLTTMTSTLLEVSTITTTSLVPTEVAPGWVYMTYSGALFILLGVLLAILVIGALSYLARKKEGREYTHS